MDKEMATHSSILAWRIPWTEEPGRPWSIGSQTADTTEAIKHAGTRVLKYLFKEVVERVMIKLRIYFRKTQVHLLS